jgi:DNA-binding IclR family transcriptional regulator
MKKIGNTEKLMEQMAKLTLPEIRSDEFTLQDFRAKFKMPQSTARLLLTTQVEQGILKSRKVCHKGKVTNAYSDAKSKP